MNLFEKKKKIPLTYNLILLFPLEMLVS